VRSVQTGSGGLDGGEGYRSSLKVDSMDWSRTFAHMVSGDGFIESVVEGSEEESLQSWLGRERTSRVDYSSGMGVVNRQFVERSSPVSDHNNQAVLPMFYC
jgi:hypothetical protein